MDLLQRLQRWYTIHCDGDWEHEYGVSISTLDNPGWDVKINLEDTCLRNAQLEYKLIERSPTNWIGCAVKEGSFNGIGGPENLSEILTYFLDEFLPKNIDPEFTYHLHLPMLEHEGQLWLIADASVVSESTLKIVSLSDPSLSNSYEWNLSAEPELLNQIASNLSDMHPAFGIGDVVEPVVYQSPDNMLRTFLVAPAKK
jgi:hypothetical protein